MRLFSHAVLEILSHYPYIAPVLVIIAAVLRGGLGSLNLLRAQTHEPDIWVIHDFLLFKLCQSVLEVLECFCNRKWGELDGISHFLHFNKNTSVKSKSNSKLSLEHRQIQICFLDTLFLETPLKDLRPICIGLLPILILLKDILTHSTVPRGDSGSLSPSYDLSFSVFLLKLMLFREPDSLSIAVPKRIVNCWLGFDLSSWTKKNRDGRTKNTF